MDTQVRKLDYDNIDPEIMKEAGNIIRAGGLVAFPTETVYGLGGDALNPESSRKIYAAKGRPSDNPLIVHICRQEDMEKLVTKITPQAKLLASKFWPGPLTMILPKSEVVPYETTGGLDTVAIRFPSHPVAQEFIRAAGGYIAAPSANLSGRPSPTQARYVAEDMNGRIDMIIDGGKVGIGIESTIVDMTVEPPMILRPGYITKEMLEKKIGAVAVDKVVEAKHLSEIKKDDYAPKAPGMKYKHYAPKAELIMFEGMKENVVRAINKRKEQEEIAGKKVGIICTEESKSCYKGAGVVSIGSRTEEATIAANLYEVLRDFDETDVDVILGETFYGDGLGQAIMNRLIKAAGYNIIDADCL